MSLTGTISQELKDDQGYILENEALPNTTNKSSDAVLLGQAQNGLEIKVVADASISIAATKQLKIEVLAGETETGSFPAISTPYDVTVAEGGDAVVIAAGEIFTFAPASGTGPWYKIKITATEDQSAKTITAYPVWIAR